MGEPLLFLLFFEMGKKEAAERYNDGKQLQGRKRRESLGQKIEIGSGEVMIFEDGLCPVTIRLQ